MKWRPRLHLQRTEGLSEPTLKVCVCNVGGSTLRDQFVKSISDAHQMIVVCSFLFGSPSIRKALRQASQRGVRVYVMTARDGLRLDRSKLESMEELRAESLRAALVDLAEHCLVRAAATWHAKFLLVDPFDISIRHGWMSSANFNDGALIESPEFAVPLPDSLVAELADIVRNLFWDAEYEVRADGGFFPVVRRLSVDPSAFGAKLVTTIVDSAAIDNHLIRSINAARTSVTLSTYLVQEGSPILESLKYAAASGISVTVLSDISDHNGVALAGLAEEGARVLGVRWLHAKFLEVDDAEVCFTSRNLQTSSQDCGLDVLIDLTEEAAADARAWLTYQVDRAPFQLQP